MDIEKFAQWCRQLAPLASPEHTSQTPKILAEALGGLVHTDNICLVVLAEHARPVLLYQGVDDSWPEGEMEQYLKGAYLLDPFYRTGLERAEAGVYSIHELAPPGFEESEYFRSYYGLCPVADEVGYLFQLPGGRFANIAISRLAESARFNAAEVCQLRAALPLVESFLIEYWQRYGSNVEQRGSELYGQLESAFRVFGTSILTPREAEIMRLYLYGYDTQAIALRLHISAHTVAAHRKNAYARLDITSQAELFSLFINSMYCFNGDPDSDPLDLYLSSPAQQELEVKVSCS